MAQALGQAHHNGPCVAIAIALHYNLPWHLDSFQGIIDYGREHGWNCVIDPYLDGPSGDGKLDAYDGIVGRIPLSKVSRVKQQDRLTVNLTQDRDLPSVVYETNAGVRLIAEHLLSVGYRHYGYVGNSEVLKRIENKHLQTFTEMVRGRGFADPVYLAIDEDELGDAKQSQRCRHELARWIASQDTPIGLCVDSAIVARHLAQTCLQQGVRIPHEVGIVVANTDLLLDTHLTPTLSVVEIDHWEQGRQAAAMLDRLMAGLPVAPQVKTVPPSRLIVRESTDIFLCEDELVSRAARYIAERSRQALGSEEVAAAHDVSRRTLDRRFEAELGHTVSHEIMRQRVKAIEVLLLESELPLNKIAQLCGFGSASQFSDYYSKHNGVSPSAFRKSQMNTPAGRATAKIARPTPR